MMGTGYSSVLFQAEAYYIGGHPRYPRQILGHMYADSNGVIFTANGTQITIRKDSIYGVDTDHQESSAGFGGFGIGGILESFVLNEMSHQDHHLVLIGAEIDRKNCTVVFRVPSESAQIELYSVIQDNFLSQEDEFDEDEAGDDEDEFEEDNEYDDDDDDSEADQDDIVEYLITVSEQIRPMNPDPLFREIVTAFAHIVASHKVGDDSLIVLAQLPQKTLLTVMLNMWKAYPDDMDDSYAWVWAYLNAWLEDDSEPDTDD